MAAKCEWCNGNFSDGRGVFMPITQEMLNGVFDMYKTSSPKEKQYIWEKFRHGNAWPKVGDKRGFFCSRRCSTQAYDNQFYGSYHSRGWFS